MRSVIIFSDMFLPTFPYLEIPMYKYLEKQGVSVVYALQEGDIRLTDRELSKTFASLNLVVLRKPKTLPSHLEKGDLLLSRFAYKLTAGDVATKVRASGHKILMYDPSGIDIRVRACPAQYLTSKSESLKRATLKKFPKQYKQIFVTGTIHNDAAATTIVDRTKFMQSYGLDPDKKLVILTPANPGEMGHQKGINNEYTKIINIVRTKCPGYEIVVKAHPLDYTASMKLQPGIIHKNEHYGNKHSWEQFAPGIKVIKADEGYKALKACDAVLNVRSSIAMETALFRKPLININRSKYTTNWPFDSKVMMDVTSGDLPSILNDNDYSVDEKACVEYCKREAFSDDGKAHVRRQNHK
ncbi:hypothetical protein LCGC14_1700560 [marine sediment metagenome]|uniref:UDP-N-acetylglucosamine 2-epimerase domain-containing protein n=1 Tax=marine sediment metagenome TaxID=412755 RepID=A0A0F9HHV1_9ZZZZ